jgi:hypothetical protein
MKDNGNLLVAILSWLWWVMHLVVRCDGAVEGRDRRYFRGVWWIGVVALPVIGGLALSDPEGLLSSITALMFVAMIGLWGVTCIVVWVLLLRGSCGTPSHKTVVV